MIPFGGSGLMQGGAGAATKGAGVPYMDIINAALGLYGEASNDPLEGIQSMARKSGVKGGLPGASGSLGKGARLGSSALQTGIPLALGLIGGPAGMIAGAVASTFLGAKAGERREKDIKEYMLK